jgi:HEAT repeat protein
MASSRMKKPSATPASASAAKPAALHASLARLPQPAQRALLAEGIRTPRDLARWRLADLLALHGIGPSAVPVLREALRQEGLDFRS